MPSAPARSLGAVLLAAVIAVVSLVSASCSSDDSDVDASAATAEPTESGPTTADAGTAEDSDGDTLTKPDVVVPDGPEPTELVIDDLVVGDGAEAEPGDHLVMHYVGVRHVDGEQFDASWDRGSTFGFQLGAGRVIQGWDQGIAGMREGGRRMLTIPAPLAYGDAGAGADIPPGSTLVFVVDLLRAVSEPVVENAPEPVSELEIEVIDEGDGDVVEPGDFLDVHYVAMLQTTGEVFTSTWANAATEQILVGAEPSQVIPAWDELVGQRVGSHVRLVIPPEFGVGDNGGDIIPPDATIITELHILEILQRDAG